jgi:D-alanyl-D-alanine carboxypeptidase
MPSRFQAFILIAVILVSTYVFKFAPDLAQSTSSEPDVSSGPTLVTTQNSPAQESFSPGAPARRTPASEPEIAVASTDRPAIQKSEPPLCEARSAMYLVRNLTQGGMPVQKGMHNRWPIASITKLMTAIVAYDNVPADMPVTITQDMVMRTEGYASFSPGETYSANDLIRASLAFSSNDAAFALASALGEEKFMRLMNEKAKELLMSQTSFEEPSGLSYLNQSSAYDLSLLLRHLYEKYPSLLATTRLKSVSLKELSTGKNKKFNNINFFAGSSGFIGGKTGSTDEAGENLATLFEKSGDIYAVIVLSSPDRYTETRTLLNCAAQRALTVTRR